MAGGKYRHRITLQTPTRLTNADGQSIPSFSSAGTIWANVELSSASETIEHRQLRGTWDATVEVRFSALTETIRQDWRFTFDGKTFEVISARDREGTRKTITIEARSNPGLS